MNKYYDDFIVLAMHAYINVGCIDVVMVTIHVARDRFQYDSVIIIYGRHLDPIITSKDNCEVRKCSLTAHDVSESISASISCCSPNNRSSIFLPTG